MRISNIQQLFLKVFILNIYQYYKSIYSLLQNFTYTITKQFLLFFQLTIFLSLLGDGFSMASSKSFIKANSQSEFAIHKKLDRLDSLRGSTTETLLEDNFGPLSNVRYVVWSFGDLKGSRLINLVEFWILQINSHYVRICSIDCGHFPSDLLYLLLDLVLIQISALLDNTWTIC